ncbi:MAG: DUF5058 family protein [Acutalibacteraceae bacterium]|nr:DUF5058 family protein [Oscillospiraceae bacterium]
MTDFKESPFMYAIAFVAIGFVIVQSVFFIVKAWKRAKELGIKSETLRQTVVSSALFTLAPAVAILATVIVLASSLGIVLPWIRLSVVGNLAYETVAAQTALDALGGSITQEVTDKVQFSAVAWVMTLGVAFGIFLVPLLCKKILNKVGKVVNKDEKSSRLADIVSAAAFIGIIAAFIVREINGKTADNSDNAGFLSIATLLASVLIYLMLDFFTKKFKWKKFEPFVMPSAMFGAMAVAILLTQYAPASLVNWTWWS